MHNPFLGACRPCYVGCLGANEVPLYDSEAGNVPPANPPCGSKATLFRAAIHLVITNQKWGRHLLDCVRIPGIGV